MPRAWRIRGLVLLYDGTWGLAHMLRTALTACCVHVGVERTPSFMWGVTYYRVVGLTWGVVHGTGLVQHIRQAWHVLRPRAVLPCVMQPGMHTESIQPLRALYESQLSGQTELR